MKSSGKFSIYRSSSKSSFATDLSSWKFNLSRSNGDTGSFSAEASPATPDYAEGQIKKFLIELSKNYNRQVKAIKKFKEYILKYVIYTI